MTTQPTTTLDLSKTWWDDATSRDLDIGVEVKRLARKVRVECTPAQIAEIRSAADYDATLVHTEGMYMAWLSSAARAVLATLKRAGL